jgi:hypothetical protein
VAQTTLFRIARHRFYQAPIARQFGAMARTLTCMMKTCVHCGHSFDPNDRWRDLSDPDWHPAASVYCSQYCSDRYHCEMGHCCSTHVKEKARREAAKAAR